MFYKYEILEYNKAYIVLLSFISIWQFLLLYFQNRYSLKENFKYFCLVVSVRQWDFSALWGKLPSWKVNIVSSGESSPLQRLTLSVLLLDVLFKFVCYINSVKTLPALKRGGKSLRSSCLSKIDRLLAKTIKVMDSNTLYCLGQLQIRVTFFSLSLLLELKQADLRLYKDTLKRYVFKNETFVVLMTSQVQRSYLLKFTSKLNCKLEIKYIFRESNLFVHKLVNNGMIL